ncbi:MAG: shikimate kinase [Anaerolineae bacterium]
MSQRQQIALLKPNVTLTGFSTTGKSTVCRQLADALGWYHVDTDALITAATRRSIEVIFRDDGEPAFRAYEAAALAAALAGCHNVVATGGGAVISPDNRALMRARAWVICLSAQPATIIARLEEAARIEPRPLLAGADPLGRITTLLAQRQAFYAEADLIVETDTLTPTDVTEFILEWLLSRETDRRLA